MMMVTMGGGGDDSDGDDGGVWDDYDDGGDDGVGDDYDDNNNNSDINTHSIVSGKTTKQNNEWGVSACNGMGVVGYPNPIGCELS